ncbi:hypothetical protein Vretimale_503, partial [Volvox reticuliferus]
RRLMLLLVALFELYIMIVCGVMVLMLIIMVHLLSQLLLLLLLLHQEDAGSQLQFLGCDIEEAGTAAGAAQPHVLCATESGRSGQGFLRGSTDIVFIRNGIVTGQAAVAFVRMWKNMHTKD